MSGGGGTEGATLFHAVELSVAENGAIAGRVLEFGDTER
jgi:hypothetical protein